jgi:proline iminopeptidase
MVSARLVTHYWANAAWLDDSLLAGARKLAGIPGILLQGALDISGPPDIAYHLAKAWPDAELVVLGGAGHGTASQDASTALAEALDRFAIR